MERRAVAQRRATGDGGEQRGPVVDDRRQFLHAYSAQSNSPVWINTGLVRKSAGAGVSQINNFNVAFTPGASWTCRAGRCVQRRYRRHAGRRVHRPRAGAALDLNSGTYYDAGGVATGAGFTNRFNGTTLILRTNIIPGLLHSGGTVVLGRTSRTRAPFST